MKTILIGIIISLSFQAQALEIPKIPNLFELMWSEDAEYDFDHNPNECFAIQQGIYQVTRYEPIVQNFYAADGLPKKYGGWVPTPVEFVSRAKPNIQPEDDKPNGEFFLAILLSVKGSQKAHTARFKMGQQAPSFRIDGEEHRLSNNPDLPGYHQKYTAYCSGGAIVILEAGSNTDGNMNIVDEYKSRTIIRKRFFDHEYNITTISSVFSPGFSSHPDDGIKVANESVFMDIKLK